LKDFGKEETQRLPTNVKRWSNRIS